MEVRIVGANQARAAGAEPGIARRVRRTADLVHTTAMRTGHEQEIEVHAHARRAARSAHAIHRRPGRRNTSVGTGHSGVGTGGGGASVGDPADRCAARSGDTAGAATSRTAGCATGRASWRTTGRASWGTTGRASWRTTGRAS